MKTYFITGTDTDCGKTYSSCQLAKFLQSQGFRVEILKPVASGCNEIGQELISEDALCLKEYSQLELNEINPWRFAPPISPHIAAAQAGEYLSAEQIADYCMSQRFQDLDYLLIEGAGGLCVPLNDKETWLDVLNITKFEVILIVGIKLGCINHSLLTMNVMQHQNINCVGWVANHISPQTLVVDEIITTLENKLSSAKLAEIPYSGDWLDSHLVTL